MKCEWRSIFGIKENVRFVASLDFLHDVNKSVTVFFMRTKRESFYPSSARVRASSPVHRRNCSSPRHMRGAQDRVSQLREIIDKLLIEYEPLQRRVCNLKEAESDPTAARLAMQDFKLDLSRFEEQIERRRRRLLELEKQVLIFRRAEDPATAGPRLQDSLMPTRRRQLSPLPALTDQKSKASAEYQILKNKTLYYERLIILRKLQLRVLHDHRDLDRLRRQFNNLGDEDGDDCVCSDIRRKCHALKHAIGKEQDRIAIERSPFAEEYFAAVAIQSAWRGYYFRMKHISKID